MKKATAMVLSLLLCAAALSGCGTDKSEQDFQSRIEDAEEVQTEESESESGQAESEPEEAESESGQDKSNPEETASRSDVEQPDDETEESEENEPEWLEAEEGEKAEITEYLELINCRSCVPPFDSISDVDPGWLLYTFYARSQMYDPEIGYVSEGEEVGKCYTSLDTILSAARLKFNPDFAFADDFDFSGVFDPSIYPNFVWDEENRRYTWYPGEAWFSGYTPALLSVQKMGNTYIADVVDTTCGGGAYYESGEFDIYSGDRVIGKMERRYDESTGEYQTGKVTYDYNLSELPSYRYTITRLENGEFALESKVPLNK